MALDSEFLALSFVFIILGVAGIALFNGPLTPAGDSCYCIIPSPEPEAAQGTSSIFLALGLMFLPMGLMKGGLPSFGRGPAPPAKVQLPSGKVVSPVQLVSGKLVFLGILLLVVGPGAVLLPGYLVFMNFWYELAGVLLTAAGALSLVWGIRGPRAG